VLDHSLLAREAYEQFTSLAAKKSWRTGSDGCRCHVPFHPGLAARSQLGRCRGEVSGTPLDATRLVERTEGQDVQIRSSAASN
jgi:hypothetical protein